MKDGFTKRLKGPREAVSFREFQRDYSIKLVVVSGAVSGAVYTMKNERILLGRGPGVDIEFSDDAMSRQHAAVEYADEALHVRDLGSTNGMTHNGAKTQAAPLEHGDQIKIGEHTLQVLVEKRDPEPETYDISVPV